MSIFISNYTVKTNLSVLTHLILNTHNTYIPRTPMPSVFGCCPGISMTTEQLTETKQSPQHRLNDCTLA